MDKYNESYVFSNPIIWKTPVQIQQLVLCNHPKHLWMSFWDIKSIIQICQSCQQNLQKMFKNPSDMRCGICLALFSLFLHNKSLVTAESVQVRSNTLFLVPLLTRNRGLFSASFSAFFYTFQLKPKKPTSNIIGTNTQRQGDLWYEMKPLSREALLRLTLLRLAWLGLSFSWQIFWNYGRHVYTKSF